MIRIACALALTVSILFFSGCKNDPINSDFGDENTDRGTFKADTIFNITYKNYIVDEIQARYNPFSATNLTLMNKVGMKARIAILNPFLKQEVNHYKAEYYLESSGYIGPDFSEINCPVYLITENWYSDSLAYFYNQYSGWANYESMIDQSFPIGYLTLTSTDSLTDTLRITDLEKWDQLADTTSTMENHGILIELSDEIPGDFIKNYKAYASGSGPVYYTEYKYNADEAEEPDTTTYDDDFTILGNYVIVDDESGVNFNNYDTTEYYWVKSFVPSHLLLDVPFDSIKAAIQDKNISYLGAEVYIPVDRDLSFYESDFRESMALFPASDTSQTTRITSTDDYGAIYIPLSGWGGPDSAYAYNTSTQSQQDLGAEVLIAGLEDTIGHQGWLIETYKFDRYFNVYAIPKNVRPYLVLKYYERPDTRF